MRYRADIDGLRAIAVLSVVAFHLGIRRFGGGFVGVDVFFVISGYLIGNIVIGEARAGTFSFAGFYSRRARRILPALLVMIALVTLASMSILLPGAVKAEARSGIAAVLSVSNFLFSSLADYFDTGAITKPLLHTWSLGVEEQYYLVFPAIVVAVWRWWPERMVAVLAGLALASLALSMVGVDRYPIESFYLLPTRAWELLLGAIVTQLPVLLTRAWWRELIVATGLAAIAAATVFFTDNTPFPGAAALLPCLGTALVLKAGADGATRLGALLAMPAAVFIGQISYSLYLWHWPIIVFAHEMIPTVALSFTQKLFVLVASLAVATVSWYFVERPFRRWRGPPRRVAAVAGLSSAALVAALVGVVAIGAWPGRFTPETARIAAFSEYDQKLQFRTGVCSVPTRTSFAAYQAAKCLARDSTRPNVLLVGDSHGAHLYDGLRRAAPQFNIMQATGAACKPTVVRHPNDHKRCAQLMDFVFRDYLVHHRVDLVVIAGRWRRGDGPAVDATLRWLAANRVKVLLVGPALTYDMPVPSLLVRSIERHDPALMERHRTPGIAAIDRELRAVAARDGVEFASIYDVICPRECLTRAPNGDPIVFDSDHMSPAGSLLVGRFLVTKALRVLAPPA